MSYTCADYREEMILLGLIKRLRQENLSEEEKSAILYQIRKIEKDMALE